MAMKIAALLVALSAASSVAAESEPYNSTGAPSTHKRGFSGFLGDDYTCDDADALGLSDSWSVSTHAVFDFAFTRYSQKSRYYNWGHKTDQKSKCKAPLMNEYVPMVIGLGVADSLTPGGAWKQQWQSANVHYLLGFNEPDFGNGHNHPHMCDPAAGAWILMIWWSRSSPALHIIFSVYSPQRLRSG